MAQSLLKNLFGSSSSKGSKQEKKKRAYLDKPSPGVRRELSFLKSSDPWAVERKQRQEGITKQYLSDRKGFLKKRRSAERDLKRQLKREKNEIDRYYRVKKLKKGDSRWKRARRDARHRYELTEQKMLRKHRDSWQKQERTMQMSRDKRRRKTTQTMKKESRKARGVEDNSWGVL
jgi:predicted ribosome quality control (RQC) complex YloA/Tae2 family protein